MPELYIAAFLILVLYAMILRAEHARTQVNLI